MFLRRVERRKNGKTHLYWTIVENKRLDDGRVAPRHVYYLGEINSSQAEAWRKAVEVFDPDAGRSRTLALFPEDRCEVGADDASVVRLRLSEMRLHRRRQWGSAGVVTSDFSQTIENCRSAASPFLLFTMTTTEWSPRPIV